MKSRILGFATVVVAWAGLLTPGSAIAEELFLRLHAPLDEPRGFCLDIPGHRAGVRLERPLHAHTCKHHMWHRDGIFDTAAFERGALHMPEYDLCVDAASSEAGAIRPVEGMQRLATADLAPRCVRRGRVGRRAGALPHRRSRPEPLRRRRSHHQDGPTDALRSRKRRAAEMGVLQAGRVSTGAPRRACASTWMLPRRRDRSRCRQWLQDRSAWCGSGDRLIPGNAEIQQGPAMPGRTIRRNSGAKR